MSHRSRRGSSLWWKWSRETSIEWICSGWVLLMADPWWDRWTVCWNNHTGFRKLRGYSRLVSKFRKISTYMEPIRFCEIWSQTGVKFTRCRHPTKQPWSSFWCHCLKKGAWERFTSRERYCWRRRSWSCRNSIQNFRFEKWKWWSSCEHHPPFWFQQSWNLRPDKPGSSTKHLRYW